ncbi:MAG: hypothetical protein ACFHWX_09440 [Bacteroidota bacterium]
MFKALYGKSLDEETFETWLEKGRSSNLGYQYLLVLWDTLEEEYQPSYTDTRDKLTQYQNHGGREVLVAAYELYSESRVNLD